MSRSPEDRISSLLGRTRRDGWDPADEDPELADLLPATRPIPSRRVLLLIGALVLAAVIGLLLLRYLNAPPQTTAEAPAPIATSTAGPTAGRAGAVTVHIVGEVARPGVVELAAGARVAEALRACGGMTKKADEASINQARILVDGEQIVVTPRGSPPTGRAENSAVSGTQNNSSVDINKAGAAELEALPGIGPVTAAAIVAHREEHGPFTSVDQLTEVSGIGQKTVEGLKDRARI